MPAAGWGGVALPACGGCAGSRRLEVGGVSFAAVGTFIFVSHFGTGQSQLGGCPRRREPLAKVGGGPSPGRGPPPYRGRELRAVNAASSQRGPHLVLSRLMPRGRSLWGSRALCRPLGPTAGVATALQPAGPAAPRRGSTRGPARSLRGQGEPLTPLPPSSGCWGLAGSTVPHELPRGHGHTAGSRRCPGSGRSALAHVPMSCERPL